MFAFILGLLPTVAGLTQQIVEWQAKKINAQTEHERIEADENIKTLQARRDVMVAEAGSKVNAFMRVFLAMPAGIFLWKVMVWDITLGWGSTDNPQQALWNYVFIVVGFYFLHSIVTRTARIMNR